ncbi:adenylate/guanylate cyclase domain-containing protein, partial [SAR116 cluster bacterium]|nr:adenylate/guanylate cyclase domain-containing protein [SAR116 cluster bacterium]
MSKDIERKIAVIFVTDVVAFSKMMEKNEDETLRSFRSCRDILDNLFKEHGGRIFNTAGDSVLAEFQSAVSAVICAKEFQKLVRERNANVSEDAAMEFRIGLNMGDVIVEGENLYGEGVNVAARLEALSQPGGVCLSKSILDFVNKKTELVFNNLGEQKVKNTTVHAYDLADPELEKRSLESAETEKTEEASKPPAIAVLPFKNMSGDEEQEYFADGITEDIITNLSLWKTFPVISRNSSFTYKGKDVNLKSISEELGVRYVVEGSVRKGGNKVRITAQLIDATEDHHLWSNKWDRSLDDIFEVQDEVSSAIAAVVSPAVKEQEGKRVVKKQTKNINAWDEYLRALSCYNNRESNDVIREHCYKSIELDPKISDTYVLLCYSGYTEIFNHEKQDKRSENEAIYHQNAQRAYDLDPDNPDAIIVLSRSYNLKKEYDKRLSLMEKAVKINPNHAAANYDYGLALTNIKDFEKAKEHALKALELTPSGPDRERYLQGGLWLIHIGLKDFDEAIKSMEYMLEKNPGFTGAYGFMASLHALKGNIDIAKGHLAKYQEL